MKKKLGLLITIISLIVLIIPSSVAMASSGDIYIELSDITIDDDTPVVGDTITISGSATITSYAEISDWDFISWQPNVEAYAEASVVLVKPDSTVAYNYVESDYDSDSGWLWEEIDAQATVVYDWSFDYELDEPGLWNVTQYGYGYFDWEYYEWVWGVGLITVSGSDEDSEAVTQEFLVGKEVPELRFSFNVPMGYGGATYPDDSMNPSPINRELDCVGKINGVQYRFVIPEGTVITNGNGEKATCFYIDNVDGTTLHSTFRTMVFSNPVTIYEADGVFHVDEYNQYIGGDWIELGSFTEIIDHIATLNQH